MDQPSFSNADLLGILRCPRCSSSVHPTEASAAGKTRPLLRCDNGSCQFSLDGFFFIHGQPVLIDFDRSIFDRESFLTREGASVLRRDDSRSTLRARARGVLLGKNKNASRYCAEFMKRVKQAGGRPRILVVGGGAQGAGTDQLYADPSLELVGTDVYASAYTCIVADAHQLPFSDASFDAVWIQAVLEHVLNPGLVVAEIWRVLRPGGVVYAETPFMQQVHEGAYDFTRFTVSGHRWLFRHFELIRAGMVAGPGTVLIWSIRYALHAATRSKFIAVAISSLFWWLRFLDSMGKPRLNMDGASGVFFFGTKSERTIGAKDMLVFYDSLAHR